MLDRFVSTLSGMAHCAQSSGRDTTPKSSNEAPVVLGGKSVSVGQSQGMGYGHEFFSAYIPATASLVETAFLCGLFALINVPWVGI